MKRLHLIIKAYAQKLEQFADRNWYLPLIAFLAALDNFVIVIPSDGILIASTMLVPKRWVIFALSMAIGSTIGTIVLCSLVEIHGLPWILEILPGIDQTDMWAWTDKFFGKYGLLLVFVISASPFMFYHPVVILAALANTPLTSLAVVVLAGKFTKFIVFAYLASHSPRLLKKVWGLKDELEDAGVKVD